MRRRAHGRTTLLLADDSVTIQRVVELTFADEAFSVVACRDGQRAIERLAPTRPDIVAGRRRRCRSSTATSCARRSRAVAAAARTCRCCCWPARSTPSTKRVRAASGAAVLRQAVRAASAGRRGASKSCWPAPPPAAAPRAASTPDASGAAESAAGVDAVPAPASRRRRWPTSPRWPTTAADVLRRRCRSGWRSASGRHGPRAAGVERAPTCDRRSAARAAARRVATGRGARARRRSRPLADASSIARRRRPPRPPSAPPTRSPTRWLERRRAGRPRAGAGSGRADRASGARRDRAAARSARDA